MKRSSLKNHERALKWEKQKVDKAVNQILLSRAEEITEKLVERALEGDLGAITSALDRAVGKVKQVSEVEHTGTTMVFMPQALVDKFALDKPIESNIIEATEVKEITTHTGEVVKEYATTKRKGRV